MRCFSILALLLLVGCVELQSNVSHRELMGAYAAEVSADGDTLTVRVLNPGGLNITSLDAFARDGNLYVGAARASSGPRATRDVSICVSAFELGAEWAERIYWVDPDGRETKLASVQRRQPNPAMQPAAYGRG